MKILITGAQGFVGSHLCEFLSQQDGIELVTFNPKDQKELSAGPIRAEKCEMVIHLASRVFIPESWKHPVDYYQSNTMGTLNVLEYCRSNEARLIYFSSVVYAQPFDNPITETHPLGANNPYTHSKLLAEEICDFYARNFGVIISILRPFNIYGPGQRDTFLIPKIIEQATNPEYTKIELQTLEPRRDYLYIQDLCRLVERMITRPQTGAFNAGSGIGYSVREVADLVLKQTGSKKEVSVTGVARKDDALEVVADISKTKDAFDWHPQVPLEQGIASLLAHLAR